MSTSTHQALLASFTQAPFKLDEAGLQWVTETFAAMPPQRRLTQLFNMVLFQVAPDALARIQRIQPGAVTCIPRATFEEAWGTARQLQQDSEVPLLISADLEGGGVLAAPYATPINNQMGLAAADSVALYEQAVGVLADEASAVGVNWSFTPVLDINARFRSAIVGTRSFGDDPQRVAALGQAHAQAMQSRHLAATAKHWPGEGFDDRDQHLVTTVNPLSMAEWRSTFAPLYRGLIEQGVMSVMSAHIALPAYAAERGITGLEQYRPACVSKLLNVDLLRGELGFNGLIVSDASSMGGLSSWGPREQVLPELIENGCDMILFEDDIDQDLHWLANAIEDGRLSVERVEASVLRILAMKAALGLHQPDCVLPTAAHGAARIRTPAHLAVSEATAAASPTLVKDTHGILPLRRQRHRRVLLIQEAPRNFLPGLQGQPLIVDQLLRDNGFDVTLHDPQTRLNPEGFDLVLYVLTQESVPSQSHIYLDWARLQGEFESCMRRVWHEMPCLMISLGQPYYLYDAPRMPCLINAYAPIEPVQRAVVRKLLGQEPFIGRSPVDAFCGLADAHY